MKEKLPFVFLGSPPIGPIALEALKVAHYLPVMIIDDPKLKTEQLIEIIEKAKPTFLLVVGFGAILRQAVLDTVAGQVLNIHPSYLPKYRGPAPVVEAILDGAKETGVSLMEIDQKMDHGGILAQERYRLRGDERPAELYNQLIKIGVNLFLDNLEAYLNDSLDLTVQNDYEATITHFVKKEAGLLTLDKSPVEMERMVRAYQDWPRTWFMYRDKRLLVDKAHLHSGELVLDTVQLEGSKPCSFQDFCNGHRVKPETMYQSLGLRKAAAL
jgi:methionyl-tRNA formyltransferase